MHVECESESDAGSNRGDWNDVNITQTVHEQKIPEKHEIKVLQRKKSYWALRIYLVKQLLMYKYKTYFTGEILHVAKIVNTEQLQHCTP